MGKKRRELGKRIIIPSQSVLKKITKRNIGYYRNLGYDVSIGNYTSVDVWDLSIGSREKVEIECPSCRKKRYVSYAKIMNRRHTFCAKCAIRITQEFDMYDKKFGRWTVLGKSGDKSRKGNHWWRRCECGSKSVVGGHALRSGLSKSCGCYDREKARERWTGSSHYLWRHDLTEEDRKNSRQISRSEEEKQWARDVKERDSFECVYCGRNTRDLHSHHLYDWTTFPEYRLNIEYGVTLCRKHHMEFHSEYGQNNNTPIQFYEWAGVV